MKLRSPSPSPGSKNDRPRVDSRVQKRRAVGGETSAVSPAKFASVLHYTAVRQQHDPGTPPCSRCGQIKADKGRQGRTRADKGRPPTFHSAPISDTSASRPSIMSKCFWTSAWFVCLFVVLLLISFFFVFFLGGA